MQIFKPNRNQFKNKKKFFITKRKIKKLLNFISNFYKEGY